MLLVNPRFCSILGKTLPGIRKTLPSKKEAIMVLLFLSFGGEQAFSPFPPDSRDLAKDTERYMYDQLFSYCPFTCTSGFLPSDWKPFAGAMHLAEQQFVLRCSIVMVTLQHSGHEKWEICRQIAAGGHQCQESEG